MYAASGVVPGLPQLEQDGNVYLCPLIYTYVNLFSSEVQGIAPSAISITISSKSDTPEGCSFGMLVKGMVHYLSRLFSDLSVRIIYVSDDTLYSEGAN